MIRLALALALVALARPAAGQFTDDFADGDFAASPAWVGEAERFAVVPFAADSALRTDGLAASDTLSLATASTVAFGTWRFVFRYEGGRLSNFNQARVFLVADTPDLEGAVRGYHLQFGTNDRDVRLYRSDPDASGGRTLLAASAEDLLPEDDRTLAATVTRDASGRWTVALDGTAVFTVDEAEGPMETGTHFGVWVKHSASRAQGYFFDDFAVTSDVPADTTPPMLTEAGYEEDIPGFTLFFSEPYDLATLTTAMFTISNSVGAPDFVSPIGRGGIENIGVLLGLNAPLPSGDYTVALAGLADPAGNVLADTTVTITVVADTTPPMLVSAEALDLATVTVTFDEHVFGCDPALYSISGGIGMPEGIGACVLSGGQSVYDLLLANPLTPGVNYTLTARDIADEAGNVLVEGMVSFVLDAPPIAPGDVVLNEIMYDAPDAALEYVELFNRTPTALELGSFGLSDDRQVIAPLPADAGLLAPGGYAVLVRDSLAFATAFPGRPFVVVTGWPALNNGGDTPTLWSGETVIDAVPYTAAWGGDGVALERKDPGAPSHASANWASSIHADGGTPGTRNSVFEIDMTPPSILHVFISNNGDTLRVVFSEPLDPASLEPGDFFLDGTDTRPLDDFTIDEADDETTADGVTFRFPLTPPLEPGPYQFTVRDVADFSGNALRNTAFPFAYVRVEPPVPGEIIVNEIMYDPAEANLEYVELFNRTDRPFALADLALADDRRAPVALPADAGVLSPGGYAVLVQRGMDFAAVFPGVPFIEVSGWPTLNNSGDAVVLFADEIEVDAVAYAPSWGGAGVSLERRDPAGPSGAAVNWASSLDPEGGTPGAENSVFMPDVSPPQLLFADQTGDRTAEVFFDEPLDPGFLSPDRFVLDGVPANVVVPFGMGEGVRLGFPDAAGTTLRVRDVRDLTGNVLADATLPLARRAEPGDVVIHEIMYDPLADDNDGRIDQPEYVELFNVAPHPISLRGFFWTDQPDEDGVADTLRFVDYPIGIAPAGIAPEGFAVVFAQPVDLPDGEAVFTQSQLALAFPEDYRASGVTLLPVRGSSLGLRNDGDLIRLHREDGGMIDAVRYDPGWHDGARATTDGIALERLAPGGPSDDPLNWTSSRAALGGTPGLANSFGPIPSAAFPRAGDLRINEIMYAPRADPDDGVPDQVEYIELFNRSEDVLDLNGLALTGRPDERGLADTLRIGFAPVALSPGGFAVVFAVPTGTPDAEVPTVLAAPFPDLPADAVLLPLRRSLGLGNAGDRVALHGATGLLLDELTYDPGWHHPSLADPRGTALARIDPDGPSAERANWTSSVDPSGGTPGRVNDVFLEPGETPPAPGLVAEPSPFSPDRDGFEDVTALRFTLEAPANLVRARVFDAHGRLVRTLEAAALTGQSGRLLWDGRDDADRELRIGIYVVLLEAVRPESGGTEAHRAVVVLARPFD